MRLIHFSDTHLGHQQYPRTADQGPEKGLNQREVDGYAAFRKVVDAAIADPPDCVIHAGDLFDGVRPSNRALAVALEGFLALSRAGIPVVVIAGNHEHPKMRETGSSFRLFDHLPGVHAVYKGQAERIHIKEGLTVHAVPQCADQDALREQVASIDAADGHNLLVLHGSVQDLPAFRHAEFNELSLDPAWFDERFDYVALGHYHGVTEVTPTAWYCGAPERVSMAESGEEKGFLDVELDGVRPRVRFVPLEGRVYADLNPIDADGLDEEAVIEAAVAALEPVPDGAVVRLRIDDLSATLRGLIDVKAVRSAARRFLHLDLRLGWNDVDHRTQGGAELGSVVEEFDAFAAGQPLEGVDRDLVVARARTLLEEAT